MFILNASLLKNRQSFINFFSYLIIEDYHLQSLLSIFIIHKLQTILDTFLYNYTVKYYIVKESLKNIKFTLIFLK